MCARLTVPFEMMKDSLTMASLLRPRRLLKTDQATSFGGHREDLADKANRLSTAVQKAVASSSLCTVCRRSQQPCFLGYRARLPLITSASINQ